MTRLYSNHRFVNENSMKIKLLFFLLLFSMIPAIGQIYTLSSESLPNDATAQSMDVKAADIDGDGDLDIVLANEFQRNIILTNDGQGNFTNNGNIPNTIHDSEDVAIADFDLDGDLDLIFCSEDDFIHEYYLNDGAGNFSASSNYSFPNSIANAVITANLNNDTFPDVIFGNANQNRIFINNGDGTFTDETSTRLPVLSHTTQDLNLTDIDNDNDLDLLVGNEGNSKILINDGQGVFQDETEDRLPIHPLVETRKISTGDINGDNFADLFFSNVAFLPSSGPYRSNLLFLNDGTGSFTDVSTSQMPTDNDDTLDAIFEDVDNDGDQDIVLANVNLQSTANQKVYINDGTGNFTDKSLDIFEVLHYDNALGVISADLNQDGFNDLYFCERNTGGSVKDLYFTKNIIDALDEPITEISNHLGIFPNPIKDEFRVFITFKAEENFSIQMISQTGSIVKILDDYEKIEVNLFQFSIQDLSLTSGFYFLKINNGSQVYYKKIQVL